MYDKPETASAALAGDGGFRAGSCVRLYHLESTSWLRFAVSEQTEAAGFGHVSLQFSEDKDTEDESVLASSCDSIWEIERTNVYEGGEIGWRDSVTLRHMTSGKYLAVSPHAATPPVNTRSPVAIRAQTASYSFVIAQDHPHAFCFLPTAVADEGCVRSCHHGDTFRDAWLCAYADRSCFGCCVLGIKSRTATQASSSTVREAGSSILSRPTHPR